MGVLLTNGTSLEPSKADLHAQDHGTTQNQPGSVKTKL
jgi:hypothetical protein